MNNNKDMVDKVVTPMKEGISAVLEKIKEKSGDKKDGVNLLEITKKLSAKKFGKGKKVA